MLLCINIITADLPIQLTTTYLYNSVCVDNDRVMTAG